MFIIHIIHTVQYRYEIKWMNEIQTQSLCDKNIIFVYTPGTISGAKSELRSRLLLNPDPIQIQEKIFMTKFTKITIKIFDQKMS